MTPAMTPETSRSLLHRMKRIRFIEESIAARYGEGRMRCPVHLSTGQEAVAAAAGLALRPTDLAVSGHRAHAHYIGKGGDLDAMMAEMYGKATGCCRGKGGSMHLIDESVGFMGSTAIVGGTVPVGVGLAYGIKRAGTDQISCVFHGDAVVETGAFYESACVSALKKLPVLFLCENNLYSVYTPLAKRQAEGRSNLDMMRSLGIRAEAGDGNDVEAAFHLIRDALDGIRAGSGPVYLEFATYRWREHCGPNYDNDLGYRSEAEFLEWKEKDPIPRHERLLLRERVIDGRWLADTDAAIAAEVEQAFAAADAAPFPHPDDAFTDLYAGS